MASTPQAPVAAQKPKVGFFTQFSLPKAITANGSQIAFNRIDSTIQMLGKLFFSNILGNRINVTQEGEDTSLQAPEFTATSCKLERLFSTGVVAFTIWAGQRLAGRKGIALATLGQLGLGMLTTLYNNSKLSAANKDLRELYNHEAGREAAKTLEVDARPQESEVPGFLSAKLGDHVGSYLGSWAPDSVNAHLGAVQAGFQDLFGRDMVVDMVIYLCGADFTEAQHNGLRTHLATFLAEKLQGQSVPVLQDYVKQVASAEVENKAGQIAILEELLRNTKVVPDLKFVAVLKALNDKSVAPEVQAIAFKVARDRMSGNLAEVMKIFTADELTAVIRYLDAQSLESVIGVYNANKSDLAVYGAAFAAATRQFVELVGRWDNIDDLAALMGRMRENASAFEGCGGLQNAAVRQLRAVINAHTVEEVAGDTDADLATPGRYEWLKDHVSVDVLKTLAVVDGPDGDGIQAVDLSTLFNELSAARKPRMLEGVAVSAAFTLVNADLIVNVLKVLCSDTGKSTPMATALLQALTGIDQTGLDIQMRVWLFAAVTRAKVGTEVSLKGALVSGIQAAMFESADAAVAIQAVHEELTSERVKKALVTTFFGSEIGRYPTVDMSNADAMVFAMQQMYDVVKAGSDHAKEMLLSLAAYAATEQSTLDAFAAKLQADYVAGAYRMTAVLHTALNGVGQEFETKQAELEAKQGVDTSSMELDAQTKHTEELATLEAAVQDLRIKKDLKAAIIGNLKVEVPESGGDEGALKQAAWDAFADRSWFVSHS